MTKLSTTLLQSGATLALGAAIIAAPLYAFAHTNADNSEMGNGSVRTITISDNGSVLVRGAQVTDVANGVITAKTTWNNLALTWTIKTDTNTDLVRVDGSHTNLSDVSDGDYISFSGALDTTQTGFTATADTIRDWTLEGDSTVTAHPVRTGQTGFWQQISTHFPALGFFGHAEVNK